MMTDNQMDYNRCFDAKQRQRNADYTARDNAYHEGVVIPSPPYKVSKTNALSTPNPRSSLSSLSTRHRNNSMSSSDDTKTNLTTPTPSTSNTTTPTNKAYKGLRHFSLMVCKKVEQKGTTSYNEVADELVRQILDERLNGTIDATTIDDATVTSTSNAAPSPPKQQHQHTKFDEKNIRRRVYDALNVLMAMNIIIKDKKAIMWRGLPTSLASASMILPDGSINMQPQPPVESLQSVQNDIQARTKNIQKKREMIQEMVLQHVSFRNLVERNYQREQQLRKETASTAMETAAATKHQGKTSSDSTTEEQIRKKTKQQKLLDNKIPLPFIVINTNKNAVIQCNMSRDLTDVMFDFTMPFEINDDNSILKRLHLYVTNSFLGRYF